MACATETGRGGTLSPPSRVAISDGWLAMGTFFEADLRVPAEDAPRARRWLDESREEIARLERIYSRHDPTSELSALNTRLAEASAGIPEQRAREGEIPIGRELGTLLRSALSLSRATGGAFDMTIGPFVELWTDAAAGDRWPIEAELAAARARVGSEALMVYEAETGDTIRAASRGMHLDLDALSKGAVLDRLRETFAARLPEAAALLSFGQSSLWAIGDPGGGGWKIVMQSRDPSRGVLGTLRLKDRALSVSSSVGSLIEIAGRRVSHVIDPRSGWPVEGTVESVVVASAATVADAWSTAMLVLAGESGSLERLEAAGLEAYVVEASGLSRATSGWEAATGAGESGVSSFSGPPHPRRGS